jgi:hypothetical protein
MVLRAQEGYNRHIKHSASPLRRISLNSVQGNNAVQPQNHTKFISTFCGKIYSNVTVGYTIFCTNLRL